MVSGDTLDWNLIYLLLIYTVITMEHSGCIDQ